MILDMQCDIQVFLLASMLLNLHFKTGRSQFILPDDLPVKQCTIGEGPGYTCPEALNDIRCPPDDDCEWWFRRPGQLRSKMIGLSLNLDGTRVRTSNEYGEYYLLNIRKKIAEGLVFVTPRSKDMIYIA